MKIEAREADITEIEVDAVVNAANTDLELGGGVAGAVNKFSSSGSGNLERVIFTARGKDASTAFESAISRARG